MTQCWAIFGANFMFIKMVYEAPLKRSAILLHKTIFVNFSLAHNPPQTCTHCHCGITEQARHKPAKLFHLSSREECILLHFQLAHVDTKCWCMNKCFDIKSNKTVLPKATESIKKSTVTTSIRFFLLKPIDRQMWCRFVLDHSSTWNCNAHWLILLCLHWHDCSVVVGVARLVS